jgi:hypothetical protein
MRLDSKVKQGNPCTGLLQAQASQEFEAPNFEEINT